MGTTALYGRIRKKEHLLLAVVDAVLGEVRVPERRSNWRAELRELSEEVHDVLLAHPHARPVIDSLVHVTPNALRIADAAIGLLADVGLEGDELVHACNAWVGYVMGFSMLETKPAGSAEERREFSAQIREYLDGLEPDDYPNLATRLPDLEGRAYSIRWESAPLGRDGGSFAYGLDLLLEALEQRRP